MAQDESASPYDSGRDKPTVPPQSDPGARATAAPKSNAINMALLELQGDIDIPESPVPPPGPAPRASEKPREDVPSQLQPEGTPAPRPEARLAPPPPVEQPVAPGRATSPERESVAAAHESTVTAPSSGPTSGSMSSTPPIAGRLERPSQRPPNAGAPAPQPAAVSAPPLTTVLIAAAVVSLMVGFLGAWAYNRFVREDESPTEPAVASSSSATDAPAEAPPSLSTAELEPLKTRLDELGKQVNAFEKQLDEASKPPAAPDLSPIRQQIDGVAKALATIDPIAKRLDGINTRMEGLETSVNLLKGDVETLETKPAEPENREVPAPSASPNSSTPVPVPAAAAPLEPAPLTLENADAGLADNALAGGVELFKQGKYQQAYNVFEKLEKSNENDARVWYYAALSYGLASGDWGETTANMAKKGVEREKAGTPKSSEIDAIFRELDSGTGKEWLAFKRKDVAK